MLSGAAQRSVVARVVAAASAALALTLTSPVRGAPTTAPAPAPVPRPDAPDVRAPPLVAPIRTGAAPIEYPKNGSGEDASVLLQLVIDTDGRIIEVQVLEGAEPFASAARDATRTWTFEPARRGDRAIRARIRVRVDFHAPKPEPEAPPDAATPKPASPKPASAAAAPPVLVEEVLVEGVRPEAGKTSLGGGEIRQLPGAFGDAFRAIEILPGVTPIVSGLPYFFVRGAPPGNTGYYIDGIRVPLLFHFGIVQSVIHQGLVERVDFYPGGYPARFGRFMGGIINGTTRAPRPGLHGEANLRLLDAGALVEASIGERTAVLAAGRYGYPGLLLRAFAPEARLDYWDYQLRVSHKLDADNRVSLFSFGSHDFLGAVDEDSGEVVGTTIRFHRLDARWDHQVSRQTKVRVATTFGFDETSIEDSGVRDVLAGVRVQFESRRSSRLTVRGGADAMFDRYDVVSRGRPSGDVGDIDSIPSRGEVTQGVWLYAVWKVTPRWELVPGIRADYFANDGSLIDIADRGLPGGAAVGADPRLGSRVRVTDDLTYIATAGVAHQPPSLPGTIPGFQPGNLRSGLQKAVQLAQGVEYAMPLDFTLAPTLFVSNYLDMTDALATCDVLGSGDAPDNCAVQRVRGRAYGLELMLRRPLTKRLTGLVSYTLSRSTRQSRDILGSRLTQEIAGDFDRTHVLNVIGAADLGRGWRAGLRFFLYTGRPYSDRIRGVSVPPYNERRFPTFYRFDWRVEKRWQIAPQKHVSLVFEWLNSLIRKEAVELRCRAAPGQLIERCEPREVGPITVPSIGVEGGF